MFNTNWITNHVVLSDDWYVHRMAKLTASEWYRFMGKNLLTVGAVSYIREKCGEEVTGIPARDEVSTKATEWGHKYEPDNLTRFMEWKKCEFLVQQRLICEPGSRFSCTPDGVIPVRKNEDGTWRVETVEAKCPHTYNKYIALANCETPLAVLEEEPTYFWQVIFQMEYCGATHGYLSVYHPLFRYGGFRVIEFRKIELISHFKLLIERKAMALEEFNKQRKYLLDFKNPTPHNLKQLA